MSTPTPTGSTEGEVEARQGRDLGLWPLVALIVGSMIGGGIFHLPAQISAAAATGPMLLGWLVFGIGMVFLVLTFVTLGNRAKTVDGGIYGYARDGLGDYVGFSTSWGYWLSTFSGSVGYLVLAFASLGHFFPVFEGGNTTWAIVGASVVLWLIHGLILSGIKEATFVNTIVTAAKVIPIILFILLGFTAWKSGLFTGDFWGHEALPDPETGEAGALSLGSATDQIKTMMISLVWYFLGIESISIYTARARKRSDAAKATLIGFGAVLTLLVAVNILAYGITARATMLGYADPSLSSVMKDTVGTWGETVIIIGVIVSTLGGYLAWMLLSAEILMYPGKDNNMPRIFGKENRKGVPTTGLWVTSICMQLMLLWTLKNANTYTDLVYLAGAMALLPYLWSAIYQVIIAAARRHDYANLSEGIRLRELVIGTVAVVFAIFLLYAAGWDYTWVACLWILIGTAVYVWARIEHGGLRFTPPEIVFFVLVVIGAVVAIMKIVNGEMTLFTPPDA